MPLRVPWCGVLRSTTYDRKKEKLRYVATGFSADASARDAGPSVDSARASAEGFKPGASCVVQGVSRHDACPHWHTCDL
eukprot:178508-Rhodomonas_salina.3